MSGAFKPSLAISEAEIPDAIARDAEVVQFIEAITPEDIGAISTNPVGVTGATALSNMIKLSQADYNALLVKDAGTLYIIV